MKYFTICFFLAVSDCFFNRYEVKIFIFKRNKNKKKKKTTKIRITGF